MEDRQADPFYYIDIAYRRKWLIIIPMLVCVAAGLFLAETIPSSYRSTTTILVEKQQVPETYVAPTNRTPFNDRLTTIRQQIISRQKLGKIIDDLHLYQENKPYGATGILNRLGFVKSSPSKEAMLDSMINDIEAKVIGDRNSGDAFSISYVGTDPYTTMQVTNMLASLFIEENLKAREQSVEGTSDFLANELDNAKKELESQERAVRAYKEKYMGALPQELDANLRTLDRLQMELQTVVSEEKNAEDRKLMYESQLNQSSPALAGSSTDPLVDELKKLQQNLASLLSMYKEDYPDVIMTRKRIKELKELLAKSDSTGKKSGEFTEKPEVRNPEVYNNLVAARSQVAALKQREAEIRKQIKTHENHVEETPANEQKYADLKRDYDISLKNYQALLEKKLNAKLSENLEKKQKGERFTVIDPANLPDRPFKPNRPMIVLASIFMGTGAGAGLALLFEFFNPVFRRPEEFEDVIDLPVLAVIPEFAKSSKMRYGKGRKTGAGA